MIFSALAQNDREGAEGVATAPLIAARGITKRFGAFTALDGVDFAVNAGEIHALLGENGAGKSTLMNVLSGLLRPSSGEILLEGNRVRFASRPPIVSDSSRGALLNP